MIYGSNNKREYICEESTSCNMTVVHIFDARFLDRELYPLSRKTSISWNVIMNTQYQLNTWYAGVLLTCLINQCLIYLTLLPLYEACFSCTHWARGLESTSRSLNERLPHVKQSVVIERGATAVVVATAVTYVWLDEVVSEDAEKSLLAKASICAGNTNKDIRFTPIAQGFLCHEYSLWVLTFYYSIVKDFSWE